ncbi:MAG: hypothetical protein HND54_07345 [Bacteroidetes bacterium]|nr:hypothetical protein [Flavobacteriales bacterium]NOG57533.1 hypothetical protein [Bacteroidota bacterium]
MSKSLVRFIIGLGIISIAFALYGVYKGGKFMDAISGIFIGVSLIGVVLIEQNKKRNKQ